MKTKNQKLSSVSKRMLQTAKKDQELNQELISKFIAGEEGRATYRAIFFNYVRSVEEYVFEAEGRDNAKAKALSVYYDPDIDPDDESDELLSTEFAWIDLRDSYTEENTLDLERIEEAFLMIKENLHDKVCVEMSREEYDNYRRWKKSGD